MAFDLHISPSDQNPAVQVVRQLASAERITPEEAAARLLIAGAQIHVMKTPAEEMLGAFSSDEDSAITDEAMKYVREMRQTARLRDFGV